LSLGKRARLAKGNLLLMIRHPDQSTSAARFIAGGFFLLSRHRQSAPTNTSPSPLARLIRHDQLASGL
jgi:hypothetical protein